MRDLFVFAYEISCNEYVVVYHELQPPDPFRMRSRRAMRQVIARIVQANVPPTDAGVRRYVPESVAEEDRERFVDLVMKEFESLDPANAIRFGLRPLEIEAWLQGVSAPEGRPLGQRTS